MKRYLLLPFFVLLAGSAFGQQHATYSSYGGQGQLSAPLSVTLSDGFYAPSGSVLRVFTTGTSFRDCAPLASSPTGTVNYVLTRTFKVAGVTALNLNSARSTCEEGREVAYFDGLGRPLQTVQVQASPLGRDIVQPFAYDAFGREAVKYLPYTDAGGSGSFRTGAVASQGTFHASPPPGSGVGTNSHPYAVTVFEPSPLNRVQEQGFPGAAWQPGGGHSSRPGYGTNAADEVALWKVVSGGAQTTGSYAAGRLHKAVSRDENWTVGTKKGTVEEFKDLEGRVVLKRAWEDESVKRDTRYVYDDMGDLRYVVPPGVASSSFLDTDGTFLELVYGYRYDGRRRVTEKKVPGKGWEHLVYNRLDQVVLTQDAKQRSANQWLFNKYDALGRTVLTGIYSDGSTRDAIQAALDAVAAPVLWETRDNGNASLTGTGYSNAAFPTVSVQVYHSMSYYDDYAFYNNTFGGPSGTQAPAERVRGLATGSRTNILGSSSAMLLSVSYYDLEGREVQTKSQNHLEGTDVVDKGYSFAGELVKSVRTHTANGATTVVADSIEYDHAGRMLAQRQDINGQGEVVLSRMHYNETGQLVKKELHSTNGGTSFANSTELAYNERGWLKSSTNPKFSMALQYQGGPVGQWNGNISAQAWGMGASLPNSFDYRYDGLNRLTSGISITGDMSEVLTYDAMGNIASMDRQGTGPKAYVYIGGGNRLHYVGDPNKTYGYDLTGNATTDGRTGVGLTYNHLNLPVTALGGGTNLAYTYDAGGRKLRKVATGNSTVTTDYVDGIHYNGTSIDFIQTAEGRAVRSGNAYSYQYNLSDHLGNVRYSFDINAGVVGDLQRDDYYPFGKRKEGPYVGNNKYLYNGKELQEELGQYDYGARFYDPEIGRWNALDPSAENYASISPYNYVLNNPMKRIDPDGKDAVFNITRDEDGKIVSVTVSATVYITGSGASKDRAKELNSYAKSIMKSKEVDGVKVSFGINYEYSKDKTKGELKSGENLLTFDAGIEGENGNTSNVTAVGEMSAGNFGTIYSSGKSNGTVLHETNHLLGLSDRYQETQMALSGPRTTQPHIGYEHDIMGKSSGKGYKAIYYQYFLNKASSVMAASDKFFYHPMFNLMYNRQNPSIPYSQVVDRNPNGTLKDYTGIRR